MIKINLIYFLGIFLSIFIILIYTNSKFFNLKPIKTISVTLIYNLTLSILFINVILNKINLVNFSLYLILICLIYYVIFNSKNYTLFLFTLKSYYLFLLVFVTTFSLSELILKQNIYITLDSFFMFLILFILSLILYIFIEIIFIHNISSDMINYVLSSISILIPISIFVLLIGKNYSLFYILNYSKHSNLISMIFLASTLLEVYFGIFLLIAISKSYDVSIYKHKNQILDMQYNLQVNNLKRLEEYQSDVRRISHDIHNHKTVLFNLIKEKDYDNALSYLNSYGNGFSDKKYEFFTNNKIINAILLDKKDICINNNINLNLDISIPESLDISDFDLCIIIGNLIDNAIEACKKIPESNDKYINLKLKILNQNFIFDMKNNFNGIINKDNDKIVTSKKDKLNHGLGLSNVKSTVEKYNGVCELNFENNEFSSFIMIPLK